MINYKINIDPDQWGLHFWHTMEAIACTLNVENKNYIYDFFNNLRYIIPCENCRNHYNLYFMENNINDYMENCLTILIWLYILKSKIKKRQNIECPKFNNYLNYVMEKYDIPEIQYHIDKIEEYKLMINDLKVTKSKFLEKYKINEFYELLK